MSQEYFGYQEVGAEDKQGKVNDVFDKVASRYDIMNDIMSGGLHRLWKRYLLQAAGIKASHFVLDIATGTGDIAMKVAPIVQKNGQLIATDINETMLTMGRNRLLNAGFTPPFVQCSANHLPFRHDVFDRITLAFGLRNMTDKNGVLAQCYRVLKPGGQLFILEFSQVKRCFKKAYDFYSWHVIPRLGRLVAREESSYQYLVESIRMHPAQEALSALLQEAGFETVTVRTLCQGIVAMHQALKL